MKFIAILLGLVCSLSACAGAEEAGVHRFTVTVEDGVEIALTTGGPRYEGEFFEYEKVLEVRPDPDVEDSFLYSPRRLAIADDGRVFVTDTGDEQVVVFDRN